MADKKKIGAALIVGGGVSGMQTALDLADAGIKAYLLDKKPAIGGVMVELDKTFPTNDCAMCTVAPKLVTIERHHNVNLLTNSEVEKIEGEPGNFTVTIRKRARYVDEDLCTGCGICVEKCPIKVTNEFDHGLSKRKAIYTLFPQAVPNIPVIDKERCTYFKNGKCKACEKFCDAKAIRFEQEDEIIELKVGAVILSPGYKLFDPTSKQQFGYGRYPNVLTSLQLERMLSASGPFAGEVLRPSDKKHPKKIAFIQCVGSREKETDYCSSVCCMYATKEAIIMKEHDPEAEITIFFIDLRAHGKGFESYYERAKKMGIKYVRCQPSSLKQEYTENDVVVRYQDEQGNLQEETFNMAVLSCGMRASEDIEKIKGIFGVETDKYGFCTTETYDPVITSKEGIYASGTFSGPMDIPETVIQASSAASKALTLLSCEKGSLEEEKVYPEERDITSEEPKVGVWVCHCGKNIASVVDINEVVEYAKTLPNVVHVEDSIFACSTDAGAKISETIKEHGLNRVVIAACTPRTHEPLFQDTLKEAGLNPHLLELANIRNQCSWVHMNEPEKATEKAKEIIKIAVTKAKYLEPLYPDHVEIKHDAMIIGGGVAGMTAAMELAEQGFGVHLIEKSGALGGGFSKSRYDVKGADPKAMLEELKAKVENNKNINIYLNTTITSFEGAEGNFKAKLKVGEEEKEIACGAVIVAIGAREYKPKEFLYGQNENVITQLELENRIADGKFKADSVVMIQCVGSRNEENSYCSRVCCNEAVKNALKIKEVSPETDVFVAYRDMRTYGLHEAEYTKAREKGVIFLRFENGETPEVTEEGGKLKISLRDPILDTKLNVPADLLVLSAGIVPSEDNKEISSKLKLPLNEDGFFMEAHIKLRPVDFSTDGIFLCGLAHSPKSVDESIVQASAAAARASALLSQKSIELEAKISEVVDENCDGCAYCVDPCPYDAITLIEYMKNGTVKKTVESDPAKCHGCGVCMATCPKKGITVKNFSLDQISDMVESAMGLS